MNKFIRVTLNLEEDGRVEDDWYQWKMRWFSNVFKDRSGRLYFENQRTSEKK